MSEDAVHERTLPGRLRGFALSRPDAVALREKHLGVWREISWAEYDRMVRATARALAARGVSTGDHVAILSDNRPEWVYADLAAQALGARSVGVYQTNPADDVAYVVSHSQSTVLFCEDQEQVDKAIEVADDTPTVEHVVVFEPRGTRHYDDPRLIAWDDFIAEGVREADDPEVVRWYEERLEAIEPGAAAMVIYTSGTTGPPKGAMISNHNVIQMAVAAQPTLQTSDMDTLLSYLPLCHVAEKIFTLFAPLTSGAVVHFGESIDTVRQDLAEVSPTVFLGVPRIWEKMHASVVLKMKDSSWLKRTLFHYWTRRGREIAQKRMRGELSWIDRVAWKLGDLMVYRPLQERLGLRNCRLPVTGAAPISAELLQWFHGIGVPILEGYGMTECAGVSHINPPGRPRLGSVGEALPSVECSIADDGEILVRGPMVFVGYLHNEDATRECIDDEGWLHTGDIGEVDQDGFLHVTGRKKQIIITAGGKNLSPEKIENALKTSPYVKEAVAIGDQRKFISALIQIDYDAVGDWASRRQLTYTSFSDLAAKDEVVKLIAAEVETANAQLARVESVRGFRLFPRELHQDDGEMTATQKVRRSAVLEAWTDLVDEIYAK